MEQLVLYSVKEFIRYIEKNAWSSIQLIVGQHILNEPVFKTITDHLGSRIFTIIHSPEELLDLEVLKIHIAGNNNLDVIIAIGGGRTIDFAKGFIYRNYQNGNRPYFLAIPTTAGSGSEATPFAVFYKDKKKVSIEHPLLRPSTVLLDAVFLKNLSTIQKATSGFDAIAQAIESIWSVGATHQSIEYAKEGLITTWNTLADHVFTGDIETNRKMLSGAHLSGKAIAISRTTGVHALSYYLTAHFGIPHGQAVSLLLPTFFLYNDLLSSSSFNLLGNEVLNERMSTLFKILNAKDSVDCSEKIKSRIKEVGLTTSFRERGININDRVDAILTNFNEQRFSNHPISFDYKTLRMLLIQNG
jgi:alcohol dehydrogenase class IV